MSEIPNQNIWLDNKIHLKSLYFSKEVTVLYLVPFLEQFTAQRNQIYFIFHENATFLHNRTIRLSHVFSLPIWDSAIPWIVEIIDPFFVRSNFSKFWKWEKKS